jgi:uncharacterized protein (DUF1778 family)
MPRYPRLDVRLSQGRKDLIEYAAGVCGLSVSDYVRENELKTALSVIMSHLVLGGRTVKVSDEALRYFTPDMMELYRKSPEERKAQHEAWLSRVKEEKYRKRGAA